MAGSSILTLDKSPHAQAVRFAGRCTVTGGYSGTPLAKKLGCKPGQRFWQDGVPATAAAKIGETGTVVLEAAAGLLDAAARSIRSGRA